MVLKLTYLVVINILAIILFVIDKVGKNRHKMRINEGILLFVALIGGSVGSYLAMHILRHKVSHRHRKFKILVPLFFGLQVLVALIF